MDAEQGYLELARLKAEVAELKRSRKSGRSRPHKLVLLLAVLDMAEANLLRENHVRFDDSLAACFERHFDRYKQQDDRCQPNLPFFHLRTSPFWRHKVRTGKEGAYESLANSTPGSKQILETIEYAYLSDYAYRVITRETSRKNLRGFIQSILDRECSAEALRRAHEADTRRRIKTYVGRLEQGAPVPGKKRPNDATLMEWIRQCKRTGLYQQGKLLYERGGLNLDKLSEQTMVDVEEDYNVCVRNLTRIGDHETDSQQDWRFQ